MKRMAMVIAGLLVCASIALAYTDYTSINSNGGASICSEQSHKKAAIRLWVMQWSSREWTCPDGTQCARNDNSYYAVKLTDCIDDNPPGTMRQCYIQMRDDSPESSGSYYYWGGVTYGQGSNDVEYWRFGQGSNYAEGSICSPTRLRVLQ